MKIINIFKETGALLTGHFKLSSGLHSGQYLQCALVLQHPEYAARFGNGIAGIFREKNITCVAGPALGGIIIAHEVAKALNVKCIFGERENGRMTLRRGFSVGPTDNVLVVEDVVTTGKSIKELVDVIKDKGARVVGVGAIVDRSARGVGAGCDIRALIKMDIATFDPGDCPFCRQGTPVVKPGSRK